MNLTLCVEYSKGKNEKASVEGKKAKGKNEKASVEGKKAKGKNEKAKKEAKMYNNEMSSMKITGIFYKALVNPVA